MSQSLTQSEQETLIKLLEKLEPGFLPFGIFLQVARLVVLPIVEFVPLRLNEQGEIEILLLTRGPDDPLWPNELHVPGTVVRPTDNAEKMYLAFDRILNDELKSMHMSSPHYVGNILHKSKRGMEQAQVYWIEVLEEPHAGKLYQVEKLPKNLMESQRGFINQAIKSFKTIKT
jgi:hypothetical protein